jgi:hypothetical protein
MKACLSVVFRNLLDLVTLGRAQLRSWARQDVEDHQFLFAEILADLAFLLGFEAVRQLDQFLEKLLDVAASVVVALDQRFEFLCEVGPRRFRSTSFSSFAAMAAFSASRSVFLCFDSLNCSASASKLSFERSIAGGPKSRTCRPVMESSSSSPIRFRMVGMSGGLGLRLARITLANVAIPAILRCEAGAPRMINASRACCYRVSKALDAMLYNIFEGSSLDIVVHHSFGIGLTVGGSVQFDQQSE